jgi:tripartite-type tricarboxylate transporter receptor subunit TctC
MIAKRTVVLAILAMILFFFDAAPPATAQTYPSRPITIVVPFAAGGPNDTLARIMAERMRASLGRPVIIENVAGANGSIGVGRVVRAAPDGYTLSLGSSGSHALNGAAYALSYDLLADLAPISPLTDEPGVMVAKKAMPANDLTGLIAWLKANPDRASAGIAGVGNIFHLAGILFQQLTGTRFQFVPYRGEAPFMQDLVAGLIDIALDSPSGALPQVRAGNIKAYAATAKSRLAAAPGIPTFDEAGLAGFYISNWRGLWAPKGTPSAVMAKLNAAVVDALADARVQARLADVGDEIFPREQQTPEALAALQKADIEKWWPFIKLIGIRAQDQ